MPQVTYYCAVCGEPNETFVEEANGLRQEFVEDCTVCCRPNVLHISVDAESGEVSIQNEFEG